MNHIPMIISFLSSMVLAGEVRYPKSLERLKSLELSVFEINNWNSNELFTKTRTFSASLQYCWKTDEGSPSKVWCVDLAKTGSWTLKAGRNTNWVRTMVMASYQPTSQKKSNVVVPVDALKKAIAQYNADGDLPHFLRVSVLAKGWSTKKGWKHISFEDVSIFSSIKTSTHEAYAIDIKDSDFTGATVSLSATFE